MSEYVSHREIDLLKAERDREYAEMKERLLTLETQGPRALGVLEARVTDLTEQVRLVRRAISDHDQAHVQAEQGRRADRRWLVGAIIAGIAAIDGPLVTILLSRH